MAFLSETFTLLLKLEKVNGQPYHLLRNLKINSRHPESAV